MGIADRDYSRRPSPQGMGGMPRPPSRIADCPVVKWLLVSNIAIYFIDWTVLNWTITEWGYFSVDKAIHGGQIWRFFTFQFLHSPTGPLHLIVNMLGLFFFGHFVERWWGSRKFLVFYLACGVAGPIFYTILLMAPGMIPADESWRPMVGASAGIYAILVAVAILAPNLKVLLYFFIPMSIRTMAIVVLGIAAWVAVTNGDNAGGEAAHLGGAILGFILMKNPGWLSFLGNSPTGRRRRPTVDATIVREKKIRPRVRINMADSEVDRILDKVNDEGLQSLTDAEREVLKRLAGQ